MTFEQSILSHLCRLAELDPTYARAARRWYYATCPWLEAAIDAPLREHWATTVPAASSPVS
jgi:hypothetical protein